MMKVSDVTVLSAIELIRIDDAFVMLPLTVVFVCPERSAIAIVAAIPTPPNAPPGAKAVTELLAVAWTFAAPGVVKLIEPSPVTSASVLREFSILSTVTPTAPRPVATLTLREARVVRPSAVTLKPPLPTEPCAPEEALSVPSRPMTATAAPTPTKTPPATEMTRVSDVTWSVAVTLTALTGPGPPSATLPIVADASPLTFTTATDAPSAPAPAATPMA